MKVSTMAATVVSDGDDGGGGAQEGFRGGGGEGEGRGRGGGFVGGEEIRDSEELSHFNPVIGLLMGLLLGRRNIIVDLFMS